MEILREAAQSALSGTGRIVLISGQAGIGKTSLALRFFDTLHDSEAQIAIGRCYDLSSTSPYAPWLSIAEQLAEGRDAPISRRMFDAQGDGLASSEALYARMVAFLRDSTATRPVTLLLDDIHWSDQPSLEFLRHLCTQIADMPLLIICTYRGEELHRDDYLYTLLPVLVRESPSTRVELRPLTRSALEEWVASTYQLNPTDQHRLVDYLARRSDGNPFFASELLRSLEERRALYEGSDGTWRLEAADDLGVPELLQQVLESRLQTVPNAVRDTLSVASVIGNHVPLDILEAVMQRSRLELAEVIDAALEARLIRTSGEDAFQFEHALTRDTLYEQTGAMRRGQIHQQVAEAMARLLPNDVDSIVYHFERASDRRRIEWLIRSGDRAARALARLSAAEKYERALDLIGADEHRRSQRAWVLYRLADARRLAEPRRALQYLDEALELADQMGDRPLAAIARFSRGMVLCLLDNPGGLDALLDGDHALDTLSDSERQRIRDELGVDVTALKGEVATWLASFGQYQQAIAVAEQYIDRVAHERRPRQRTVADAWDALGVSYAALGRPADATVALRRAVESFDEQGNYYSAAVSTWEELLNVALIYFVEDIERREETAHRARDYFMRSRTAQVDLHPDWPLVPLYFIEGEWDRAYESAEATLQTDAWSVGPLFWIGSIDFARGRFELARERILRGLPAGFEAQPGSCLISNALRLLHLGGAIALAEGKHDEAQRWAETIGDWISWSGRVVGEADYLVLRARIDAATGDVDSAIRNVERAINLAMDPRQPLTLIAALRTRGQLLYQTGELSAAANSLAQSEEIAVRCRARYSRALTLLSRIQVELELGHYVPVRGMFATSRELIADLHAVKASTLLNELEKQFKELAAPDRIPGGLTNRELEVLRLVASGMTDAEVAAELGISPRTVSNHLASTYSKLGVSSRAAATRFAVENHLV